MANETSLTEKLAAAEKAAWAKGDTVGRAWSEAYNWARANASIAASIEAANKWVAEHYPDMIRQLKEGK